MTFIFLFCETGGYSISKPNLHVQRVEATSNKSQGGSQIGTGEFCHRFSVKVSLSNNPISKELKETFLILEQELKTDTLTTIPMLEAATQTQLIQRPVLV